MAFRNPPSTANILGAVSITGNVPVIGPGTANLPSIFTNVTTKQVNLSIGSIAPAGVVHAIAAPAPPLFIVLYDTFFEQLTAGVTDGKYNWQLTTGAKITTIHLYGGQGANFNFAWQAFPLGIGVGLDFNCESLAGAASTGILAMLSYDTQQ